MLLSRIGIREFATSPCLLLQYRFAPAQACAGSSTAADCRGPCGDGGAGEADTPHASQLRWQARHVSTGDVAVMAVQRAWRPRLGGGSGKAEPRPQDGPRALCCTVDSHPAVGADVAAACRTAPDLIALSSELTMLNPPSLPLTWLG